MRDAEKLRAFELRLRGMSWMRIGMELNYDPNTVYRAVVQAVDAPKKLPLIRYPALCRACLERYDGSIPLMAEALGVNAATLKSQLSGASAVTVKTIEAVRAVLGLTYEEAFRREEAE